MAWQFHWKAPLQTKGFLKIIELVVAILCLALVASYSYKGTRTCLHTTVTGIRNFTTTVSTHYPLYQYEVTTVFIIPINTPESPDLYNVSNFGDVTVGQGAQFFVAWSVATMFYCVAALAVYIVITANEQLERVMDLLVYADLVFHCLWVFFWFVACVDWAVSYSKLHEDVVATFNLYNGGCSDISSPKYDSTAQAAISVVFGFLSLFLWAVNIFWVLIDTPIYIKWKANRAESYQATP